MPTENELKFVLDRSFFPSHWTGTNWADWGVYPYHGETLAKSTFSQIHQGYLFQQKKSNLRIRSQRTGNLPAVYTSTYKRTVVDRVVELEMNICQRDFQDLWHHCEDCLKKIRYFVDGWELDLFLDTIDTVYFVLAEHEMPEGQDQPEAMPAIVKESLLYAVPRDDDRFSSRKLASVNYAERLLYQVRHEVKKDKLNAASSNQVQASS